MYEAHCFGDSARRQCLTASELSISANNSPPSTRSPDNVSKAKSSYPRASHAAERSSVAFIRWATTTGDAPAVWPLRPLRSSRISRHSAISRASRFCCDVHMERALTVVSDLSSVLFRASSSWRRTPTTNCSYRWRAPVSSGTALGRFHAWLAAIGRCRGRSSGRAGGTFPVSRDGSSLARAVALPPGRSIKSGDDCGLRAANPIYIPRNHLVEEALTAASENADLILFEQLLDVVTNPYPV